ncbi:MAG TPA: ABC transporter permease [Candidatus Sumerlaeota bacterium]|nr:ABC transporter permease [Candidatus Sumerlaeota bacterium]HPS00580.1 ABC transporter permease [Candidatus Sumerlaeota bacterium]
MIERIRQMLIKEFLQMFRDPRMRMVVFAMPVVQMLIFAFALTTDVTHISLAVLDDDNTPASRELVNEFTSSDHFQICRYLKTPAEVRRTLDRGLARSVLHIQAGFENDLQGDRTAHAQFLSDGAESTDGAIVVGYANFIMEQYVARKQREKLDAHPIPGLAASPVSVETRAWYNPNLESKHYFVPGLIAVMLMVVSLLLTSLAIVAEKEIGTIEQIMVTPIHRLEFILGKTIPYLITGYITLTIMLGLALVIFDVRVTGSWFLLYVMAGVYIVGNLGLALTISVSASTRPQALLTAFFLLMPGVLLSGFMFPLDNMPTIVRYATVLNPMRWFLEILRDVTLKGSGVETLWPAMLAQTVLAILFLTLAASRFHKTLA